MLSDIAYLIRNREKPKRFKRWLIVWAKRAVHFVALIRLLILPALFRLKGADLGRLVVIGQARIQGPLGNLHIGDQSSLGRCEIAVHDTVNIGRCVVISDGAVLLTAGHSLSDPHWKRKTAPISIGDYAWIATNAIVMPGVSIGVGAVVGAGAVVRQNVADYSVVAGNPAVVQAAQRSMFLSYAPALLNAPFEAWIGRENKKTIFAASAT